MARLHKLRCCAMADLRCSNQDTLAQLRVAVASTNHGDGIAPDHADFTAIQAVTHSRGDQELEANLVTLGFRRIATIRRRPALIAQDAHAAAVNQRGKRLRIWLLEKEAA